MAYSEILYETAERAAIITLNRPDRLNALTPVMNEEVHQAINDAEADPAVGAIVITGAGKSFCPGMDMGYLASQADRGSRAERSSSDEPRKEDAGNFHAIFGYMLETRKPIIGAINGNCVGMGLSMALHFDLRVAGESTRMCAIFVRRGLSVEHGSSWTLPRLIGMARALDIGLTGRMVGAQEALQIGLVSRVVPDDRIVPAALEIAREMAANCSPSGMAEAKRMLWQHLSANYQAATSDSNDMMIKQFKLGDFKEGVKAFTEKRAPHFKPL